MGKSSATTMPTREKSGTTLDKQADAVKQQFVGAALSMSWQLIVVVLVPLIAGAELDKANNSGNTYVIIGLVIAVLASIAVIWRAVQRANKLPVPKLTAAQKKAIQKSYEEEDEDN